MPNLRLETPRLYLRQMKSSDVDDLLKIFADPKVMAAFTASPFDRQQMEYWLRRNLEHQDLHGYGLFSVILKSDDLLIGDCGLENMELDGEEVAELGYDFRSDYWNQGFASEAAAAVRDYAFDILEKPRLISLIRVGNEASKRVSEKIGMRFQKETKQNETTYWIYAMDSSPQG